ncbi:MAG: hypothetical protein KatS3mg102_1152 [Planctomycetota bacterium]|nr:MAG: hypothetical protein KatS3mg102_1152 [Planctomycetota bacterium]
MCTGSGSTLVVPSPKSHRNPVAFCERLWNCTTSGELPLRGAASKSATGAPAAGLTTIAVVLAENAPVVSVTVSRTV